MAKEQIPYTEVIVEKRYPIGYISINRPEKRNSLTWGPAGTQAQLAQACDEMRDDPKIRVFVLKGNGPCFCSGFELGANEGPGNSIKGDPAKEKDKDLYNMFFGANPDNPESIMPGGGGWWWESLWKNPKPSIAQVHSFCLGAGLFTINNCDVVYATPDAVFGYPPIRYGCPMSMGFLPPWLLGARQTRWMALTGWTLSAEEALRCGLITKVIPREKMDQEIEKLAMAIAKVPPITNIFTKWSINNYYESQGIKQHIENSGARG